MSTLITMLIVLAVASIAAWFLTVPLHRFKEFRPKCPRDIDAEVGRGNTAPQIVRAAYRRAICPHCRHDYERADVVPIISWFRGCPGCHERLPVSVLVLQIGVPLGAAITAATLGSWGNGTALMIPFVWLVIAFGAVSIVDMRIWLIPYWMPWLTSAVGLVLIGAVSLYIGQPSALIRALVSGAATFGMFFVLWFVAPGKLGFSDVRLALPIGMFLGWLSPVLPVYGILFGSLLALVVGLISVALGRGNRFAFGPALSLGALTAVWFASPILGW